MVDGISRARSRHRGGVTPNLTSMVDVVFILVVFFMLVAHLSKERLIKLKLPNLDEAMATENDEAAKAFLNVVPESRIDSEGGAYRLGALSFEDSPMAMHRLTDELEAIRGREPGVLVVVRAERTESFDRVRPALEAVSRAGIRRVDLAVVPMNNAGGTR
jgi:biopolymer transport protein ExbD